MKNRFVISYVAPLGHSFQPQSYYLWPREISDVSNEFGKSFNRAGNFKVYNISVLYSIEY